jgi:hypothetical protein
MKSLLITFVAATLALTAGVAVAQSDPHHPATTSESPEVAGEVASPSETASPEQQADAACPDGPSMTMEMMMGADGMPMPMMQMVELMKAMQELQAQQLELIKALQAEVQLQQQTSGPDDTP